MPSGRTGESVSLPGGFAWRSRYTLTCAASTCDRSQYRFVCTLIPVASFGGDGFSAIPGISDAKGKYIVAVIADVTACCAASDPVSPEFRSAGPACASLIVRTSANAKAAQNAAHASRPADETRVKVDCSRWESIIAGVSGATFSGRRAGACAGARLPKSIGASARESKHSQHDWRFRAASSPCDTIPGGGCQATAVRVDEPSSMTRLTSLSLPSLASCWRACL